jgi:PAS domain S-box-containing protein
MTVDKLDVGTALEDGEFLPHFQPVVNLRTGEVQGFEILARWLHPQLGWIPPDEFIPLAEHEGWIGRLTEHLLRQAFEAVSVLPGAPTLAINISALQLHDPVLPDQIQAIAELAGFSLNRLIVEITESALANDVVLALSVADALKALGCKLALDDFGTGYSSLTHLQSLPFDELKVDRSFVSSMTTHRDSRKIVAAVVGLGQSLGLTTVAEGVERQEQAEMLRWLGCDLGQGWLFGRPVHASQLASAVMKVQQREADLPDEVHGRISASSLDRLPGQRLAQLQAVYDGAPVGLAFLDRELRYMNLNRRLAKMNGRSIEEHLGRTVSEMVPELFPVVEPFLRRALGGEAIQAVEASKPVPGGAERISIVLSYEPARDEAGEVIGVQVAVVDVTEIKRAEEARIACEDNYRYMMELMPQIPWIIDPEGRALDVSQRWLELTGTTDDQWRGFGWLDSLHPDDRQPTIDAMKLAFETGEPIDILYRLRRSPDYPWKSMRSRGSARIGTDGKIVCWYGCLEDADPAPGADPSA